MSQNRVCIHGHFYQPPRENPFTGRVENQVSAGPFSNWNERIVTESYEPNLAARVLDDHGDELRVINNYEWISHDFGPTLLSWLEVHRPETYRGIIDSDRLSMRHFGGHGSAMAQSYNHTILPLSTSADKRTQIKWGIADFAHRYSRAPRGLWLPETAVDIGTLQILADEGIEYTVLSPYQAGRVEDRSGELADVSDGTIDPRLSYNVAMPGGKQIAVFFYNGPLSQEIAFNGLLNNGHDLAKSLLHSLTGSEGPPMLSHVATDGETYGHHHRHGEMALAAAIGTLSETAGVALTNYSEFLALNPPQHRVEVAENSSWSCIHGVERWRSDCSCSTGGEPHWNQKWRAPLRAALDWLRDQVAEDFTAAEGRLLIDPWQARDTYIEVLLGRPESDFIDEHGVQGLDDREKREALGLLEIQHRAMLMYTSCGWFFNDISGLESIFVLRQAGRVVELAREVNDRELEPQLLERLAEAMSNHPGVSGREIYLSEVEPYMDESA